MEAMFKFLIKATQLNKLRF